MGEYEGRPTGDDVKMRIFIRNSTPGTAKSGGVGGLINQFLKGNKGGRRDWEIPVPNLTFEYVSGRKTLK